ncbi:MAG: class I SAM-dependent methyltransferase [Bacteroidia bacterium]|nr:class I SAM-dependent methyltransferase [Bacteroidia bacterium]
MNNEYELFKDIVHSFAVTDFERNYVKGSLLRAWKTLQLLESTEQRGSLLDVGGMRGIYAPAYIELWGYENVTVLDNENTEETSFVRTCGDRKYVIHSANCNIELQSWPFEDEQFDTVIAMEVFEHLIFDPMFAMNELCRVLKPGGTLLMTVPNTVSDQCLAFLVNDMQPGYLRRYISDALKSGERSLDTVANLGHFHEYTRQDLVALLSASGFEIQRLDGFTYKQPLLHSFRLELLNLFVRLLFPRAKRIRDDVLRAVARKQVHIPLDQLPYRYPEPIYMSIGKNAE